MESRLKRIENFIFNKMRESGLPALSLAVVKEGEIIYSRGFGQRDKASGKPATADTLYGIGSITKSFTALAVMQLQEKNKLQLTDPVADYLDFSIEPGGETITIEHLLAHTSGIPALAYAEAAILNSVGEDIASLPIGGTEDMLTFMQESDEWWECEPGERWFYLNEGYVLLGGIIARVSGKSYQDYIRENILDPLNMQRSYFSKEKVESDHDAAQPYLLKNGEAAAQSYLYGGITSDGGLISNARDMANYLKLYLARLAENKNEQNWQQEVISASSIQTMARPQVEYPHREIFASDLQQDNLKIFTDLDSPTSYYGLGLSIEEDFLGVRKIGHGGSVLVATAQLSLVPAEDLGIILLANGSGYPLSQLADYALATLMDKEPARLPAYRLEKELEELSGDYSGYQDNYQLKVTRQGNSLKLKNVNDSLGAETTLFPQQLSVPKKTFYTITAGKRLPVEFYNRDDETILLYGRYKLKKK